MATLLLSAAGAALGGSVGGTVLGLSMTAVGRLAGATLGRAIDQRLLGQGGEAVESGRVDRLRLSGSGEGEAVAQVYGRLRVPGQVIWATRFREHMRSSGGGKGLSPRPETREYSYSVSLALALCEGEITGIGRIWADGVEIARDDLSLRLHCGEADQMPDPLIEAVEGAGQVPAYRGTAYMVIEDLDLSRFGNRVPQFNVEVMRAAPATQPGAELDPVRAVRAVAVIPGSGEYALATTPVYLEEGAGRSRVANVNTAQGIADIEVSLRALEDELPALEAASLVVGWFGDDLRCGACTIAPRIEQDEIDSAEMPWRVAGLDRASAGLVARDAEDRPVYGGTPADASVIQAIEAMKARGQAVMYYPFILMEQAEGNTLPDPWTGDEGQPALPWRGRITCSLAPGRAGSPDGSAAAEAEVAAFFGTAAASDFTVADGTVSYSGPDEWRYRRFILHQAALCAAAGGVESFCIGSEMRGLTRIRGADHAFPAVEALRDLAGEVRAILGPDVKLGYAADWSEHPAYQSPDGNLYFHLDPLWSDAEIDFIGIDNYMPLSDWREGEDHADAHHGSIYDLDYLAGNVAGGEGFDWYYHSPEAEAAQIRTPITDGAHDEPWVYRYKDLRSWWSLPHHDRIDGQRSAQPTAWLPQSKPIWFTEYGCAAIDKGSNQPNRFLDPKSSESLLPRASNGQRDELIQLQYLRAMAAHWTDAANNPDSELYDGAMVDWSRAFVWAWDARPWPAFPNRAETWSDGANHARGHWITGRTAGRRLASVVGEICARAGLTRIDTSGLHGYLRGFQVAEVGEARAALQALMLRYGFDAVERDGLLRFVMRDGVADVTLTADDLASVEEIEGGIEESRAAEAELAGRVRLRFIEAGADYEPVAEEAVLPDDETHAVAASDLPLVMTRGEGRQVVQRWLAESRIARDTARFALPPSHADIGPGDVIRLGGGDCPERYRVDRVERGAAQILDAVRIDPETWRPVPVEEDLPRADAFAPPVPVLPLFMDLPLLSGDEVAHAPHLAVTAEPWPGTVALYSAPQDADYRLNRVIAGCATLGVTTNSLAAAPPGRFDRANLLTLRLTSGSLASVSEAEMLNGANLAAIGSGSGADWEVFQFRDAMLIGPDTWQLGHFLRGQQGSDALMPEAWPEGSYVVLLDGVPGQIDLALAARGLARHYRTGPARRGYDDPSYRHHVLAFDGAGLRPYSPCHLRAAPQPGGDIALSWIRRSRIGGDSWQGLDVPLGEESEAYLLRVSSGTTVLREVMLTAPGWSYDAAMQAEDGGPGSSVTVEVAQVSALYGPGAFVRLELAL